MYRDDLEATHARLAAVEAELARVSAERDRLRDAAASPSDDGSDRIAELEAAHSRVAAERDRLRAAATGISAEELDRLLTGLAEGAEREGSSFLRSGAWSLVCSAVCFFASDALWNHEGASAGVLGLVVAGILLVLGLMALASAARIADRRSWQPVIDAMRHAPEQIVSVREMRMSAGAGGRFVVRTAGYKLWCYHRQATTLLALLVRRCPHIATPPPL